MGVVKMSGFEIPFAMLALGGAAAGGLGGIAQSGSDATSILTQAQNQERENLQQAETDTFDATVARQEAANAIDIAAIQGEDFERAGLGELASFRASKGGSGFEANRGSSLMIDEQHLEDIILGKARTGAEGRTIAARLKQKAALLDRRSLILRDNAGRIREGGFKSARNTRTAGFLKAGTSFAGTLASVGSGFAGSARSGGGGGWNTVTTDADNRVL